jgi:phosphoenolpyruvate phosphomutase
VTNINKAKRLRDLFKKKSVIRLAGAHDGISAKLVELNGFDGVWASGFEVSASYAVPDASILTMTEYLRSASVMSDAVAIPVVADCDTGFGNSNNVAYMVKRYEDAGIAAVVIEDKLFPKVNSYIPGRQELAPLAEFVGKILAAKNAQRSEEFMVIARLEALIAGWGQEEALRRAYAYVEAGADAILVHSKSSTPDEITDFARAWDFSSPLVIIPTSYPMISLQEIERLGIKMVIYANPGLRAAVKAINEVLSEINRAGRLDTINDRIVSMDEVFELQGMRQMKETEKMYLLTGEEPVKVIIPAAGAPFNQPSIELLLQDRPLAMLDINGKPLLQRNIETLYRSKLYNISVIRGYKNEAFDVEGITYFDNPEFRSRHILTSIMRAEEKMDGKTLIIYSDILFENWLIDHLKALSADFVIIVDNTYKKTPYRNKKLDLVVTREALPAGHRTMTYDRLYRVEKISKTVPEDEASAEFIGIAMFSKKGIEILKTEYHKAEKEYRNKPFYGARDISQASLEHLLQRLIDLGYNIEAMQTNTGWMEIHSFDNYKYACSIVP